MRLTVALTTLVTLFLLSACGDDVSPALDAAAEDSMEAAPEDAETPDGAPDSDGGRLRGDDAAIDEIEQNDRDIAEMGLAPRCAPVPICFRLAASTVVSTVPLNGALVGTLGGMVATSEGLVVMHGATRGDEELDLSIATFDLDLTSLTSLRLASAGELTSRLTSAAVVALGEGRLLTTWRPPLPARRDEPRAAVLQAAIVSEGGVVDQSPLGVDVWPLNAPPGALAAVVVSDAVRVARATADGVLITDPFGSEDLLLFRERAVSDIVALAALDAETYAVVWTEQGESPNEDVVAASVDLSGSVMATGVVARDIRRDEDATTVLAHEGSLLVATFERDYTSLVSSRVRVARLDPMLARVRPDVWFDGWGGLSLYGTALVAVDGRPLLLWRTLDDRYGSTPVLQAAWLDDGCGSSVMAPLLIWEPYRLLTRELAATAAGQSVWVGASGVRSESSWDIYRFDACE